MHIRVNIPPKRVDDNGWHFPELGEANKFYTLPLANIMLREGKYTYRSNEYSEGERRYVDIEKTVDRY